MILQGAHANAGLSGRACVREKQSHGQAKGHRTRPRVQRQDTLGDMDNQPVNADSALFGPKYAGTPLTRGVPTANFAPSVAVKPNIGLQRGQRRRRMAPTPASASSPNEPGAGTSLTLIPSMPM